MALEKHELTEKLDLLSKNIKTALEKIDITSMHSEISAIEADMAVSGFWDNQEEAQKTMTRLKSIKGLYETWSSISENLNDLQALFTDVHEDDYATFEEELTLLEKEFEKASFVLYFSGEYDKEPVLMTIKAGAGGDDAEDFAGMLLRMYMMYADKNNFTYELQDYNDGAGSSGIKKASIEIRGPFAYGMLKGEKGVHRIVRLSPFKSSDSRQTSFVHIDVMPLFEHVDMDNIEVRDEDLRVDTFRSSGPGGQNVNKVDSAIRLTHIPSGIVVACQSERSQHQNKERAMFILKSKLYQKQLEDMAAEKKELSGENVAVDFGKQIRSYVLHPYKMVKDHRTDVEVSNVDAVLDGYLEPFIDAEIKFLSHK